MMVDDTLSIHTAQHWFSRVKNGNLEFDDLLRPRRPLELDVDLLSQATIEGRQLSLQCLAQQLGYSYTGVEKYLRELGETWKYGV